MKYNQFGECYTDCEELFGMLYKNPNLDLAKFNVDDAEQYNSTVAKLYAELPLLVPYTAADYKSLEEFDQTQQSHWHMTQEYLELDIAKWLLDQCRTEAELQRIGQELLLYQERDLFNLLRYLKYMVDTLRKHGVLWGLGRGSSVASYALYLIGVHKINSMYYDLDVTEFLR
jgi:DNA polymerase III alpha subunit